MYVPFGRVITRCPQQLHVVIKAALNEFGSCDLVPTGIANCASLSYLGYQVNDVELLFQTPEQRLNARKYCGGRCPIVAPVYLSIFFEKIVKSVLKGANQDSRSLNLLFIFPKQIENAHRLSPDASRSSV